MQGPVRNILVTKERIFSPHHTLLRTARRAAERLGEKEPGWQADALTVILTTALAVEALCNVIGERLIHEWGHFDRLSPWSKLRLLAEHLDVVFSRTEEPWKSLWWLLSFRNHIAHGKPKVVKIDRLMTSQEREKDQQGFGDWFPEAPFEKELTIGKARQALQAVDSLLQLLVSHLDADLRFGLEFDGWTGSAKIIFSHS